ncbi:MAG: glycosyltransferase family 2 protein [Pirellulales bacterium]
MLTVLIPCKNERSHMDPCIESVQSIADEILVADSGSTDGTIEIARSLGCRVIEREYRTSGDFKNWAIPQAAHEWVLVVDADERVTPELADEIRELLAEGPTCDGYRLRRINYFLGRPIRHGDWGRDQLLRLFRRDMGRYVGHTDHADVHVPSGRIGRLHKRLIHHSFVSYSQCLAKSYRYANVQAELWHAAGRRSSYLHLLTRGPLRFFRSYVVRLGFLDGIAGLQCSILNGYGAYLKQACLWEMTQQTADRESAETREPAARAA